MAFAYSIRLTSITIPNSVKEIGRDAFAGCTAISSVSIPNSISEISRGAFSGCSSLKSVAIGNSVTKIGESAFWDCSALTDVTVLAETPPFCSNNYDESNYTAFDDSDGTIHITLHVPAGSKEKYAAAEVWKDFERIVEIGKQICVDGIYYNILSNEDKTCEVTYFGELNEFGYFQEPSPYTGSITIPDHITYNGEKYKVTRIRNKAFSESSITEILIPQTVIEIGSGAFYGCTTLSSVSIPNGVINVNRGVFYGCTSLKSVTLPASLTFIDYGAFWGCYSITDVIVLAVNPPIFSNNYDETQYPAFGDYDSVFIPITLHVPAGCKAKYMTAEVWKDFENIVEDAIDYPYLLEVPSNTYATLYLHYNAQIPDGMKVYVGKSTDYGYLQLEEITGTIPANTGVVVQAPAGSYELAITTASSQASSVLMGVNEDTAVESGTTLVLSEHDGVVGFYRYGGTMLKAHRAYLPVSVAKNGTIRISMPDGIQEVMSEDSDAVQYDLFGNRLQNRQKGINIENGKLIYVK